jgi:hypothetical protein
LQPPFLTAEARRLRRLEQLQAMSDEQFAAEVGAHQAANWRPTRLTVHVQAHRRDFLDLLGGALTPEAVATLSRDVLSTWDRLFTELERDGTVSYTFTRSLPQSDHAIILIVRTARIRTLFPTEAFADRLERHPAAVEVTDRAKRLGL